MRLTPISAPIFWRLVFWGSTLFLVAQLVRMTDRHAVNVLFYDQWEFWEAMFKSSDPWQMFRWQHGPHRQGAGYFVIWMVAQASGWNTRTESMVIGGIIIANFFVYAMIWRRVRPEATMMDLALPALALTLLQWETIVLTPNPAHGSVSCFLLACSGWLWLQKTGFWRDASLLVLNFLAIHTGFTLFLGLLTPLFFLMEGIQPCRDSKPKLLPWKILAASLAAASLALFFFDYHRTTSNASFAYWHSPAWEYVAYMACLFGHAVGFVGKGGYVPLGCLILGGMIVSSIWHGLNWWRTGNPLSRIVVFFCLFALIFSAQTAYGRVSTGLSTASSSRYVIYLIPGLIGLALALSALNFKHQGLRMTLFGIIIGYLFLSACHPPAGDRKALNYFTEGKKRWVAAYLENENAAQADLVANFQIYPFAERLGQKLAYLKKNRLNLYIEQPDRNPSP